MEKLGEYTFKVLPFEADFRGKITLPHLLNYMLNSAGYHAEACGFGIKEVNANNLSWVLSRVVIELYKYPRHGEKIQVQTWVEGVMRTFTMRNFAFLTQDNETLGYARTIWALIDKKTRRPVDFSQFKIPYVINPDMQCPIAKPSKIAAPNGEKKDEFTVKYSDVDFNQHLNSSKYIEHVIDAFTLHKFSKRDIKRFEIEYMAECMFKEKISLYKNELPNNEFIIELKNEQEHTVCKSKVVFGEQGEEEQYIISKA